MSRVRVVVTAGPTYEFLDPVRFLGNVSSGRMGFAIAEEAARKGHAVTLIAGPVHRLTPARVKRIDVVSAREMLAATRKAFRTADALFMTAAVADWRPVRKLKGKWRKGAVPGEVVSLDLVQNPDILATVAARKGERLVVGFALETADGVRRAREKMKRKGADYMVLNDASALNADRTSVTILGSDGSCRSIVDCTKKTIARNLVKLIPS